MNLRNVVQNHVDGVMVEEVFDFSHIQALKSLNAITFKGSRGVGKARTLVYTLNRR